MKRYSLLVSAHFAFARLDRAPIAPLNRLWAAMLVVLLLIGGALHPAQAASTAKVALVHADFDNYAPDVKTKLMGTGRFAQVDLIDVSSGKANPTLTQLQAYDAVLTWSNASYADATGLGNVLADYADSGKRVVVAVFASDPTDFAAIQGRLASGGYLPFIAAPGGVTSGTQQSLVADIANDPLLVGVNSFNGGSRSYRQRIGLATGAVQVAHWTDNLPLVAHKEMGSASVVGLNFAPPSSSVLNNLWDASTDGAALMANALLASLNKAPVIATNTGLRAPQAATATITAAMLNATDADNDTPLTYTVTTAPTKGTLGLSGAAATTFTQADIAAGRVSYTPSGSSGTTDTFAFTVNDGKGGVATGNFAIVTTEKQSLIVTTDSDNSTDSDNETSLREAIAYANSDGVASAISFDATAFVAPRKTIKLNGTQLSLANDGKLTITAPSAGVEISGDKKSRVFDGALNADVTLTGLTIRDGNPQGQASSFNYNSGSGIARATGNFGGGIFNRGNLLLDGCTLFDNVSQGGGAIASQNDLNSQALTLRNCTLSGNSQANKFLDGDALLNVNGLTVIENSTIVGNPAAGGPNGGTIAVATFSAANSLTRTAVRNSIIAGNAGDDVGFFNPANTAVNKYQSNGFNLIGDGNAAGTFVQPGDQVIGNDSPGVAALADNGGPTPTRALSFSSPALNTGDTTVTTDQRGVARPQAGRADKGAFELEASNFTPSLVVTTLADEDNGTSDARVGSGTSLREAIIRANSDGTNSTITFAVTGTIRLTRLLDALANDGTLTISNAQSGGVIISGDANGNSANDNGDVGLFAMGTGADVTLKNLTLRDGRRNFGGAVFNNGGKLTLINSTLTKNVAFADGGGAISNINTNGVVTITNCTLSENSASAYGGAISGGGSLSITNSKLSDNTAGLQGGAINSGPLEIVGSTLSGNSANRFGGAINADGPTTISASTLSGNSVTSQTGTTQGGAINSSVALTISSSTLSDNTATASSGLNARGGAIYASGALTIAGSTLRDNRAQFGGALYSNTDLSGKTLTLRNCTLSGNMATTRGGGLRNFQGLSVIESCTIVGNEAPAGAGGGVASYGDSNTRTEVRNSIIAGNTVSDVDSDNGTNSFKSNGFNLIGVGNATGAFNASGDVIGNTAPGVAALADNGGPTQTRALLISSPAVNTGDTTLGVDQRGVARPQAGRADKGAFELEASNFTPSLVVTTLADEDDGTSDARVGTGTSLREAILRANTDGVASTITFSETVFGAPRQTIKLNGTELPALADNNTLTISAPLAGVEISGDKKSRVFLVNSDADVTMTGLTIRDGDASSNFGGGIYNVGKLLVDSCTLKDNSAGIGGALYSRTDLNGKTLTLRNCTLSGNTATGRGGGLRNIQGLSVIESCTIVGNEAPAEAGGGVASSGNGITRTEVRNSIIAGNTSSDVDSDNGTNSFQSNGYNLIGVGNATGAFNASGDVINNTAPGVAALADNMGRVPTRALLAGSPAINAGDPAFDGAGKTDARGAGFARVRDGRLDIGAFEVQNEAPVAVGQSVSTLSSQSIAITLSATDANGDNLTYSVVTPPANGKVTLAGNVATYTPNAGYVGADSFTFKANDGKADSNVATVNINVVAGPAPPESGLVVTTLADVQASDGVTSLREAVDAANRDGKDSPITFAVSGTINLTGGELTLVGDGKVSIVGPAKGITINGDSKSRVFNIASGADATFSGLNITGGNAGNANGGAILNNGALTLNGSTLFNNAANSGGAIANGGALTLVNSTLAGNSAQNNGGGIFNSPTATMTSLNSTIVGNAATSGGGIFKGKTLNLSNSIVVGNTSDNLSTVADVGGSNITSGTNAAAGLDPAGLRDNGGPVKTIALTTRGTAVNAGDNTAAASLTTDGRGAGFPRIVSSKVDIGAFESAFGNRAPSLNNATFSTSANVPFSMQLTGTDADGDSLSYSRAGGTLPDGITLSSTGLLSGTPTKVGRYDFQVNVFDGTDITVARFIIIVSSNADGIGPIITRPALNASYTRDEFAALVYRGTVRDVAPAGVTPSGVAQVTFQLRRDSDGFAYSGNETDGFTSNVNLGYFPAFLSDPVPGNTAAARDYRRTFGADGFVPSASVLKPGGYSLVIVAKDVAGNYSVEVVPVTITAATSPATSAMRGAAAISGGNS